MARVARADVFDPREVSAFHCIHRCVRRSFLCGDDPYNGRNYEHRKPWIEQRLQFLAGVFGIDVLGFAILSNHFHLVVRNRPDVVATWSDTEVATRWLRLCPIRKTPAGEPEEPTEAELDTIRCVPEKLAEIRLRLSDISWLMRMLAEPIARQANKEENVQGHFFQGRFKSVQLCDEAAILACLAYIDLNPIRAGLAETPETSDFTSAQRRIESLDHAQDSATRPDAWLTPIELSEASTAPGPQPSVSASVSAGTSASATPQRASDKGCLPMTLPDYLELLDWTGRQMVAGKSSMPDHLPPILQRLGMDHTNWLPLVRNFGRLFHRVAGAPRTLDRHGRWKRFRPGRAELLGTG